VSSAGTLARGNNVTGATRVSLGYYQVSTNFNVTGCSYQVTTGDTGTLDPSETVGGYARAGQTAGDNQKVSVLIFRNYTVREDIPFHLEVVC
jgi:hypothetical protein